MVGGAGLYIDSVLYDYSFMPRHDDKERVKFNAMTLQELLKLAQTRGLDTSTIDTRNKRRVIRLLENNGVLPTRRDVRAHTLLIGLRVSRESLRARVEQRVDAMFAAGLVDEVQRLSVQYGWNVEPMKGIGYRELRPYFMGEADLASVRETICANTMKLAKKQRTWFKRNPHIQWISEPNEAERLLTAFRV